MYVISRFDFITIYVFCLSISVAIVSNFTEAQLSKTVSVYLAGARKRKSTSVCIDSKKKRVVLSDTDCSE